MSDARCGICALIELIRINSFDDFVAELADSYVILGDAQFYRGYCVILAKTHATEIYLMPPDEAHRLFEELRLVAEAIASVTRPWKLNYACLGNEEPHVHWHIFPRYQSDELRRGPVWMRSEAERKRALSNPDRIALIAALREAIVARFPDARIAAI
ncbi:MAG TPA: HIT family protein [Candidatus Binataceae bacterium]|nr:HIT family protein [Candidatus Binataceae bacterium]